MSAKILVVDDEQTIADLVSVYLENEGYYVYKYYTAKEALGCIASTKLDMAILDVMLPGTDGFAILRTIRKEHTYPVIMLTAREQELDKINGLALGADDYITKPFGSNELLARIRTAMRHGSRPGGAAFDKPYKAKGLVIDFDKRLVSVDGESVHLTQVEFKIVSYLARNSGRVITYDSLISHVWGPYADDNNRILRVNMANIRRKLEKNPAEPQFILTEIGVGYRMAEDENQENE